MAGEVGQADFIRDSSGEVVGIRNGAQEFYGLATPSELATVRASVSGGGIVLSPRSPVEAWCLPGGYSSSGLSATTWQHQHATRIKGYVARLSYFNPFTSTPTIDKTTITPSTTYVQDGDPTGGATPVNVTFSGSASVTHTAAASTSVLTHNQSDWVQVSPLDRTDVVGAPYLWHIRSYCAAGGQAYNATLASLPYAGNVAAGLIRRGSTMAGDKIASPSGFVGTNGGLILSMAVEFRGLARAFRVAGVGDSILQGAQGASVTQVLTSYLDTACHIANNQTAASATTMSAFWSAMNFGWATQSYTLISARLAAILAAYKPDAVLIPVWSPNSSPGTQAATDLNIAQTLDMVQQCINAGAVPILATMPPRNSYTITNDNPRKAINNAWRKLAAANGFHLVDLDALLSDNATPAQLIPAFSDDGLHWNAAGTAVAAAAVAAKLLEVGRP